MSKTVTIACDLHDVIANLRDTLMQALNEVTGKTIHWREWHTFHLHELYPITDAECIDVFHRYDVLSRCVPEPDAIEALSEIRSRRAHLAIITSSGWHAKAMPIIRQWLSDHGVPFDTLHITPWPGGSKSAYLSTVFKRIDYLIDDSPGNIRDALASPLIRHTVVVDRPWNQSVCTSVPRVKDLSGFLDLMPARDREVDYAP